MAHASPHQVAAGAGPTTTYNGPGVVYGLVLSHSNVSAQTVILYDSTGATTPVLMKVIVNPNLEPVHLRFDARVVPRFETGLTVDPGACEVAVFVSGGR